MKSVQIGNNIPAPELASFGMDGKWLEEQLKKAGKSQADLARHLNLQPPVVNKMLKGKRRILASEADLIRAYLGGGNGLSTHSNVRRIDPVTSLTQRDDWQRTVPVYGTVAAGAGGLQMGDGRELDWVRRPSRFEQRKGRPKDIFAVIVEGTSMQTAFEPGALAYIDPLRPPQIGDYVIAEIQDSKHAEREALLKRLAGQGATKITLEQYNPPHTWDVPRAKILTLYRVMTLNDLLG